MSRRESLRVGIPDSVALPKFLTTDEINSIKEWKKDNPNQSWEDAIAGVIKNSPATLELD